MTFKFKNKILIQHQMCWNDDDSNKTVYNLAKSTNLKSAVKDLRKKNMDTNELKTYSQNETGTSVAPQVNNTEDKGKDYHGIVTASSLKNLRRRLFKGTKKVFKVSVQGVEGVQSGKFIIKNNSCFATRWLKSSLSNVVFEHMCLLCP